MQFRLLVLIEESREDVGDLSRIVPFSWVKVKLILADPGYSLNGKKSLGLEIIKITTYYVVLFSRLWFKTVF